MRRIILLSAIFLVSCLEDIPLPPSFPMPGSKKSAEIKETQIITGVKDTIELVQSRSATMSETDFGIGDTEIVVVGAVKYKGKIFMTSRDSFYVVENSKVVSAQKKTRNAHHIDLDSVCIRLKWDD